MRLFAAVVPPADVVAELEAQVGPLRDHVLRWTTPDAWHLTLAFFGEVGDERLPDLGARLARAARRRSPMELGLVGAGRFDGRALWMGCAGDVAVLRDLARSLRAAGRRVGASADEERRFRPHVTLARSSRPLNLRPYVAALAGYKGRTWTARDVALVRSELGMGDHRRPRYQTVSTFGLGP